jgi:hypothetical protein
MKRCENETVMGAACRGIKGCTFLTQLKEYGPDSEDALQVREELRNGNNVLKGCVKEVEIRRFLERGW